MTGMLFDFSVKLTDKDGDSVTVDGLYNPLNEIERFLSCTKTEAETVLARLKKDYDVFAAEGQIILTKGSKVLYNFEECGQTYWHGHKYNTVNEWDFKDFVGKGKVMAVKKLKPKKLALAVTEKQIKKALQLDYARRIGFDVTRSDYQRFYLL